jgi:hypothetical protein
MSCLDPLLDSRLRSVAVAIGTDVSAGGASTMPSSRSTRLTLSTAVIGACRTFVSDIP